MLKRRLIPCLFLQNGLIVRSQEFRSFKQLGNPLHQLERLSEWDADELVYVDITREGHYDLKRDDLKVASRSDVLSILRDIATKCFMPLTFGGRIDSPDVADGFIANGADKVVVNTAAYSDPELITRVAETHGSQAMVVALDVLAEGPGRYGLYVANGRRRVDKDVVAWAREAVDRGAGELFVNAIHRDGTANGYDLELARLIDEAVDVPVVLCGGAGTFEDFVEAFSETGVSAVAAGNIFNFTENAYPRAKKELRAAGISVR